ncbi:MAG: DUF2461 domain-containing protein [Chitinophagaceae bacterium]
MITPATIKFLKDLKKNNNKPWFDANRKRYEEARENFMDFIQSVISLHGKKDPSIRSLSARDCMFRINRDIRFSKDKSPYKTNFGASINRGGRKAWNSAGYYFHLEPGNCFAGGGIYMPDPESLKKIRQEIDYNLPGFKKILAEKNFKTTYGDLDRSAEFLLSRVPKGYEPGNPAAEYLRLKSYIAMIRIPDTLLVSKDLTRKTVAAFADLQPLIQFINTCLD